MTTVRGQLPGGCLGSGVRRHGRRTRRAGSLAVCVQRHRALLSRSSKAQCIPAKRSFIKKALLSANRYVFQKALREESLAGMGTTAVCALVRGGKAYLSHAGDSRAYLYRDGKLAQLTHDHSYVQELVDCGTLPRSKQSITHRKTSLPGHWAWTTGWSRSSPPWRCRQGMFCCYARTV